MEIIQKTSSAVRAAATVALLAIPLSGHAEVELIIDSGQLTGARNVLVGDVLYDVEFLDGTCAQVFDGCDEYSDFPFPTDPSSEPISPNIWDAMQALIDQVMLDGPLGNFDSNPSLTRGCDGSATEGCASGTPHQFNLANGLEGSTAIRIGYSRNLSGSDADVLSQGTWKRDNPITSPTWIIPDLTDVPNITWARWTISTVPNTAGQLQALVSIVMGMNLQAGISNALDSKLSNALNAIDDDNDNNDGAALNMMYAFCSSSEAQRGKKLTDAQVDELIAAANGVIATLDNYATPCF